MSIPYRDRQPPWKTQESPSQRWLIPKFIVAVILMVVVIANVLSVLPAPTPNIPVTGAQPEPDRTLTFKAAADARVEQGHPALNAGASPDLEVIHASGQNVESYLRFTVRGISGAVQSARVRVYSTTETAENGPALYTTDKVWKETEMTWENRPRRASRELGNQDLVRRYSWVEYDVTSIVSGEGTYSFVMVGDSGEDLIFSSRESSNGPELVITLASTTPTSASDANPAGTNTSETGKALTFTAAADASVLQDSPDANHGTSADLHVNGDSDAAQITYITFSLSGIRESIHNVKLRLFSTRSTENGPAVHFAESSWNEAGRDGITWAKQPTLLSGPMDNQEAIEEGSWTEYDVTAAVTGDGTYTFALVADGPEAAAFSSREGTEAPQLVVTTGLSAATPTANPDSLSQVSSEDVILVGAGDIATCDRNQDELTAELLDDMPGTVFTLGDNAYVNGSYSEYLSCYDSSWGRNKSRTRPIPGNHDYNTSGAAGYFQYFNNVPSYYAYDLDSWRIYALNSEIDVSASSPQIAWLVDDLAGHPSQCVLAYWHKPRWSSGTKNGSEPALQTLWQILYDAGAELVLTGHEHNYERFAEMDGSGAEVAEGLREIVVGTGGAGLYEFGTPLPTSQIRDSSTFGVLKLTLHDTGYDWEFVPIPNSTFTDSGSGNCH
jgi:Calcineurin-like phosphoesterase